MAKSAIICVDDEKVVLESLKTELEDAFGSEHLIEVAENANDAIELFDELIKNGYRIPIIISDYIMPGMKGDELLKIIHEKNTRTYKIMLTGQAEAYGIANAVNYANLYKVISKPWDYEELIFSLKEAIKNYQKNEFIEKQYFELKKNKELTDTLKKINFKNNKLIEENKRIFNHVIPSIIGLSCVYERGYFLNHTKFIIGLSLKIADEIQLSIEEHTILALTGIILHKITQEMPEQFIGVDPNTLDPADSREYFKNYNQQIDKLSANEYLNKYVLILSQLWEHYDGTGLPLGLTLGSITKVSQILNLSINYHNGVYRLPPGSKEILKEKGEIIQTPEVTAQRHAATMHDIFKKSSWYDLDIIDVFQKLVKSKISKVLLLEKGLIKVYAQGDDIRIIIYADEDYHYDNNQKIIIPVERLMNDFKKKKEEEQIKSKRSLETSLSISELRSGMIADCDIVTKFGRVLVAKNSTLNADDIEEITKTKKHGLLSDNDEVKVLIPREA